MFPLRILHDLSLEIQVLPAKSPEIFLKTLVDGKKPITYHLTVKSIEQMKNSLKEK